MGWTKGSRRKFLKGAALGATALTFPLPWVRRVNAADKI